MTTSGGRRRGRPAKTDARAPLTKDSLAGAGLRIAGDEGFGNLTMRRLADEVGVTVRALYNVVADRQEVVDLVAARMIESLPEHDYPTGDWRASVRRMYQEARAAYRLFPRATLISLDETVTATEVPDKRILAPERMLAFLVDLGLTLDDALAVRSFFLVEIFGFVLLVDYRYDRSDAAVREMMSHPVPRPWLDAHPDVAAPLSREVASRPGQTPEHAFEAMIERAIADIERRRSSADSADQTDGSA